mmetsp:Transcript_35677/g.105432  ORF Transcript_35677/g.105432 Transcript_35677/m.105432 type:complete len:212 (-) Transcript_35677:3119-3754(-)
MSEILQAHNQGLPCEMGAMCFCCTFDHRSHTQAQCDIGWHPALEMLPLFHLNLAVTLNRWRCSGQARQLHLALHFMLFSSLSTSLFGCTSQRGPRPTHHHVSKMVEKESCPAGCSWACFHEHPRLGLLASTPAPLSTHPATRVPCFQPRSYAVAAAAATVATCAVAAAMNHRLSISSPTSRAPAGSYPMLKCVPLTSCTRGAPADVKGPQL